MNAVMVFLIIWAAEQPLPTARFLASFPSMKACNEFISRASDPEVKEQLRCLQVIAEPKADASEVL